MQQRYILKLLKERPRHFLERIRFFPKNVVWELTLRCNMNCAHCGSTAGHAREQELNHDEALDLCRQLGEMGCEILTLLGGEPFMREDWDDLALCLGTHGVRVNAISNGYAMDQSLADRIKKAHLTNVAISVDGLKKTHEKIRRKPDCYQRALDALDILQKNGISTAVVTTICRDNLRELDGLYETILQQRAEIWQIQIGVPRGRLCEHSDYIIQPENLPELERFVLKVRQEGRLRLDIADNIGYFGRSEEVLRAGPTARLPFWTGCYAGIQAMGIDANGDIKGCLSMPSLPEFIEGNVRTEPLKTIWERPGAFSYNRDFRADMLEGDCAGCEYGPICRGGCKSTAYCFTGSFFNNPYCFHRIEGKGRE